LISGIEDQVFVEAVFMDEDGYQSTEIETFVRFKHLSLEKSDISVKVTEDQQEYVLEITSKRLVCFVELDFEDADAIFSDNYFNLTSEKPKIVRLRKSDYSGLII
jgi:beta-mannosidase